MEQNILKKQFPCTLGWESIIPVLFFGLFWLLPGFAVSQDSEESTIKSRMSLSANQLPDQTVELVALLRAKIDGNYEKIPDSKIGFFALNDEGDEKLLGESVTGPAGTAKFLVSNADLIFTTEGMLSFVARFDGNKTLTGSETDLQITPASLVMMPMETDSTYTLHLEASAMVGDSLMPVAGAPVSVYVQRMFSQLKVASGETDDTGMADLEFPNDLFGDDQSNLTITALIEDTDDYGNLKATMVQQWGKPVSFESKNLPRALWSQHPPTWMVIAFFVMMGTVWGHYIIIIIELYGIKSEKPLNN